MKLIIDIIAGVPHYSPSEANIAMNNEHRPSELAGWSASSSYQWPELRVQLELLHILLIRWNGHQGETETARTSHSYSSSSTKTSTSSSYSCYRNLSAHDTHSSRGRMPRTYVCSYVAVILSPPWTGGLCRDLLLYPIWRMLIQLIIDWIQHEYRGGVDSPADITWIAII